MYLSLCLVAAVGVAALPGIPSSSTPAAGTKYFITFGDSYSQTGFNITGAKPSTSNPLGNPNTVGYTTSGGLNWIGDLVEKLNTSITLSYNFAYGGATVDASLVAPYATTVLSFIDQVKIFTANLSKIPFTGANALFGVWMGVNDVGRGAGDAHWPDFLPNIMDAYFAQIATMYSAGGRNFLLLSVPPTNLTPTFIAQGIFIQDQLSTAIDQFNAQILNRSAAFEAANSGSKIWVYNTTTPFMEAIDNPTKYGAKNATCYNSDGTTCLWFNDYHPGQAIHSLVAQGISALLKGVWF